MPEFVAKVTYASEELLHRFAKLFFLRAQSHARRDRLGLVLILLFQGFRRIYRRLAPRVGHGRTTLKEQEGARHMGKIFEERAACIHGTHLGRGHLHHIPTPRRRRSREPMVMPADAAGTASRAEVDTTVLVNFKPLQVVFLGQIPHWSLFWRFVLALSLAPYSFEQTKLEASSVLPEPVY